MRLAISYSAGSPKWRHVMSAGSPRRSLALTTLLRMGRGLGFYREILVLQRRDAPDVLLVKLLPALCFLWRVGEKAAAVRGPVRATRGELSHHRLGLRRVAQGGQHAG